MENISKIVLCRQNGRYFGYVIDVALDEKLDKVGYYVVDEQTEAEYFLPIQDAVFKSQCVFVENESVMQSFSSERKSVFEKQVWDDNGTLYGRVERIVFSGCRCIQIETSVCEICAKDIAAIGDDFLLLRTKKKRKTNTRNLKSEPNFDKKKTQKEKIFQPEKVSLSANFYIGNYAEQDVFGYNNERVVARGQKITKTIFENVKKHNKLNELFFVLKNHQNP